MSSETRSGFVIGFKLIRVEGYKPASVTGANGGLEEVQSSARPRRLYVHSAARSTGNWRRAVKGQHHQPRSDHCPNSRPRRLTPVQKDKFIEGYNTRSPRTDRSRRRSGCSELSISPPMQPTRPAPNLFVDGSLIDLEARQGVSAPANAARDMRLGRL
jgi:hypothetical protein